MRSLGFSPRFQWGGCTSTARAQMTTHSLCSVPDPWPPPHWAFPNLNYDRYHCGHLRVIDPSISNPSLPLPPHLNFSSPAFYLSPGHTISSSKFVLASAPSAPSERWGPDGAAFASNRGQLSCLPLLPKSIGPRFTASSPIGRAEKLPRWLGHTSFFALASHRYQWEPARDLFSYRLKPRIGVLRSLVLPIVD